jgi:hypothetical protein
MSKSWVEVVSRRRKTDNSDVSKKITNDKQSIANEANEKQLMPRLFIWRPVIRGHHVCHISTIAFTKEQAISYIMDNLRRYKKIKEQLDETDRTNGKQAGSWRKMHRELLKTDESAPIIAWEGPFTGSLYDLLDQKQMISIDPYSTAPDNFREVSFEMFLNRVDPEIRLIKLGMMIGSTSLDG